MSTETTPAFDPHAPHRLGDHIVLRPEPFGALVYDLRSRQLLALRDPQLAAVLEGLSLYSSAAAAVAALAPGREGPILQALGRLAGKGLIRAGT